MVAHAPPTEPYRLLHVGLGPLGRMIVADIQSRGVGRIVGAVDISPEYAGRRLVDIVPGSDPAVEVRQSLDAPDFSPERLAGADCAIVATSSDLAQCMPTFRALLSRGVSVVSTCEELLYPRLRHAPAAAELERLTRDHGARLLGTGVNPGFLMDAAPVFASAVCRSVRSVAAARIQDATTRRVPFQRKIGAGLDDAEFERRVQDGTLRHVGLGESVHFIADLLGFRIDRWEETIGPVRAERDMDSAVGPIRRGSAAGVRQVAMGFARGGDLPVVTLEFQAAIGQADPHDRIVIDGEPPIDLIFCGGVHGDVATCAIVANCIGPLLSAPPGLHTMATIPMPHHAAPRAGVPAAVKETR